MTGCSDLETRLQDLLVEKDKVIHRQQKLLDHSDRMLKEVQHRARNTVQLIVSMIGLRAGARRSGETRQQLNEIVQRVMALALVQERQFFDLHGSRVDFGGYLDDFAVAMRRNCERGDIRLDLDVAPLPVPVAQAVPLGLITHEAVSNSFRHAFPEGRGGVIRISLRPAPKGKGLLLVLADDGIGFTDAERPDACGLRVITALAAQIDADLAMETSGGTTIRLAVPV